MDFPATPAEEMPPAEHPDALLQMLGVEARFVGRHAYFLLLDVGSDREVRELDPDFARWLSVDTRSAIVTAPSDDPQFDFVSRFFAPAIGINEDPVTGAAHCCLGPYWADRLGKATLAGFQASARGGVVHVAVRGDRVTLGGNAVTVMRGELTA